MRAIDCTLHNTYYSNGDNKPQYKKTLTTKKKRDVSMGWQ